MVSIQPNNDTWQAYQAAFNPYIAAKISIAVMELKGSKSYKNYVLLLSGFFLLVCVLSGLSVHSFIPTFIVMPLVVFIISLQKFTTRINVSDNFIEIEYWQLFQQKRRSIPLPGSSSAMRHRTTKGGGYWELKITSDVEPNYGVDARNGLPKMACRLYAII